MVIIIIIIILLLNYYYKIILISYSKTLSRTVRSHFLRKNFFLVFCLGQLRGLPNNNRHSSRKKTKCSCGYDLPVAIRWSLLRRKEEGKLKAFEKYLVDEKKNIFLDALWFGTQSLAFIEVYSHC